jgi:hypothetical protein
MSFGKYAKMPPILSSCPVRPNHFSCRSGAAGPEKTPSAHLIGTGGSAMRKAAMLLAAIGFVLAMISALPAQALSDRTWVSGTGTDSGACTRAAPCATFNFAHSQTNPGGEINCVDAGFYARFTITKSITISCEAGTAGMFAVISGTSIDIEAADTDIVTLRGLDINGFGVGTVGIRVLRAKQVHVEKCTVRNFRFSPDSLGIFTRPDSNSTTFMYIVDSIISDNSNGISLQSGGGFKVLSVKNTIITGSASHGVNLGSSNVFANITEAVISGNGGSAVNVAASSTANIDRTTMANNGAALTASASGATIRSIGNNIFNNTTAFNPAGGGTIASDGQNRTGGNTNGQDPNASVTLK